MRLVVFIFGSITWVGSARVTAVTACPPSTYSRAKLLNGIGSVNMMTVRGPPGRPRVMYHARGSKSLDKQALKQLRIVLTCEELQRLCFPGLNLRLLLVDLLSS